MNLNNWYKKSQFNIEQELDQNLVIMIPIKALLLPKEYGSPYNPIKADPYIFKTNNGGLRLRARSGSLKHHVNIADLDLKDNGFYTVEVIDGYYECLNIPEILREVNMLKIKENEVSMEYFLKEIG